MNAIADKRSTRKRPQGDGSTCRLDTTCIVFTQSHASQGSSGIFLARTRMQAKHVILYAPSPIHSLPISVPAAVSALFYVEDRADVIGWYAQSRRSRYSAAFFMIENFYANRAPSLFRSVEDDVYGPWRRLVPQPEQEVRCPLSEPLRHELERLQSLFIDEWLFFPSDPRHDKEVEAYRSRQLPLHAFNVRERRLGRFNQHAPVWVHQTPGNNPEVLDLLQKCWRFYGKEAILSTGAIPPQRYNRYDEVDISSPKKGPN